MRHPLGSEPATRRRFEEATVVDHRVVEGAATDTPMWGSFQPLEGEELEQLDVGDRRRNSQKVYTNTNLRIVEGSVPCDHVIFDGIEYEVHVVKRYRQVLPHYSAVLLELQEGM